MNSHSYNPNRTRGFRTMSYEQAKFLNTKFFTLVFKLSSTWVTGYLNFICKILDLMPYPCCDQATCMDRLVYIFIWKFYARHDARGHSWVSHCPAHRKPHQSKERWRIERRAQPIPDWVNRLWGFTALIQSSRASESNIGPIYFF